MGWGYWRYFSDSDSKPKVTFDLLKRVFQYAKPYRWAIAGLLFLILIETGLGLLTPLIFRDMIDRTLPNGDTQRLNMLALALIAIPVFGGFIGVIQRMLNARIGEGVIYDLRVHLYSHLQRMSLRFFTHTKTGELMSRLNNDVIGAQRAISDTIVSIITNLLQVVATLAVLFYLQWWLTLLGVLVLPFFILAARQIGRRLRVIAREAMEHNAQMNAMMNETLNIGGVLLVKLFGRSEMETSRFADRASKVRDKGIERAIVGRQLFMILGLVSAAGTALTYWLGGH